MDERDLIREAKNLVDRFFSEWITLFSEYDKTKVKELEEMEKELPIKFVDGETKTFIHRATNIKNKGMK